ncbi:hypothetical protein DFP72DRAFT_211592 [Ephemerocybe angulata]|uniref:Uncharacterized protein n=1 Tax=Ephemerocybe angulata TaxID=980116 RepID=A0A8H6M9P1_9AGAR|nr:hypothetical protein DFP72DRAFT_211592 [Tulosesus angulatus]
MSRLNNVDFTINALPKNRPGVFWPNNTPGRFFRNALILQEIMECVSEEPGNPNPTLLALALTNKAVLLSPVLDAIWKTMHSLGPFLRFLPHDGMNIMSTAPATGCAHFMGYANRLRHLRLAGKTPADTFDVVSLLRFARHQPPDLPLFPSLQSICFTSNEVSMLCAAYTEMTAHSPITTLEFTNLHTETKSFGNVLSSFALRYYRSLKTLKLHFPDPRREFGMRSMQYLSHFTDLQVLSITCLHPQFPIFQLMELITGLEALRDLRINIRVEKPPPPTVINLRSKASSLSLLRLEGPLGFIGTALALFDKVKSCDNVILIPNPSVDDAEKDILAKYVAKSFRSQPDLRFELPGTL